MTYVRSSLYYLERSIHAGGQAEKSSCGALSEPPKTPAVEVKDSNQEKEEIDVEPAIPNPHLWRVRLCDNVRQNILAMQRRLIALNM